MEVSGSHGGAKQQQRVFVVLGSRWESLGAVGVKFSTNDLGVQQTHGATGRRGHDCAGWGITWESETRKTDWER